VMVDMVWSLCGDGAVANKKTLPLQG